VTIKRYSILKQRSCLRVGGGGDILYPWQQARQDKTRQDGEEVSSNLTSCECSISIVAHARNMG